MNYFSMPADFKKETIDAYEQLNQKYNHARVIETYGSVTVNNDFESGRTVSLLPQIDWDMLREYANYGNQKGLRFNYTLNGSHMLNKEFTPKGVLEILGFIGKLANAGIRSVTVALPSVMEIIASSGYDMEIKASVICLINNPNKAMVYKNKGISRIVADETITRDFKTLKKITRAFGDKVEIIVNSICHQDCTHRMFHYNQISCDSTGTSVETATNYYNHRCLLRRYEEPANLLRLAWVRPEDLKYYNDIGIRYFKIQGRHTVLKGDPVRAVECYFKESFDGDLLELLDLFAPTTHFKTRIANKKMTDFIKPFVEKEDFCARDCPACRYCDRFAEKCIDHKEAGTVSSMANTFYNQYDSFKTLLDAVKNKPGSDNNNNDTNSGPGSITADFDLG